MRDVLKTRSKLAAKAGALVAVEPTVQTRCGVCGCCKLIDDVERCRLRAREA